ncbi:hypothetical protein [Streptacidiphilus sp. EB129]|uniref:hypothetical protein n=1 Tax=Streptacidiphilus sp. EB129 TaxID=3156262 RepID=UPI003518FF6A
MTGSMPKARCPGCGLQRQITTAGLIRRHNRRTALCPGAGQPPAGPVTAVATSSASQLAIPAPTEPTWGRSCDGGKCNAPSVGWRLYRGWREWLPVCGLHMAGTPGRTRVFDRDLPGGEQP